MSGKIVSPEEMIDSKYFTHLSESLRKQKSWNIQYKKSVLQLKWNPTIC